MRLFKKMFDFFIQNPYFSGLLTFFVAVLCFMPAENIPDTTDDKTAHFLAFGALSFSWYMSFKSVMKVALWLSAFAVLIEIVQYLLPESFHRGFDLFDILADLLGVFLGIISALFIGKFVK